MTTPKLITDEIVRKFYDAFSADVFMSRHTMKSIKAAILAIQDDITRPVYNLLRGYKQDAEAYERALKEIEENICWSQPPELNMPMENYYAMQLSKIEFIISNALKGNYHKTDFTEFCEET